jgi:FtsP/CotA-like multicopper oxidase with cupredoxin domain
MVSRFVDYAGYYVIHCHILAHEDRGMMTVVYVTPLQPPFSHH